MKLQNVILIGALALFLVSMRKASVNGIGAIEKTKFLSPYDSEGKTTFSDATNRAGVYIIKEDGVITYVGYSAKNLYRTLYRHFQRWNHPYQQVTTYQSRMNAHSYTVRVIYTTPLQAERLEAYLVNKYQPRDNDVKLKQYAESNTGATEYKKYTDADLVEPF
jgi:hypothetical protein